METTSLKWEETGESQEIRTAELVPLKNQRT
jgi:hypothetical protein